MEVEFLELEIEPALAMKHSGLRALVQLMDGVVVKKSVDSLEDFKKAVALEVKAQYRLETLKGVAAFRAYRDFFWGVGIDPTKTRPAAEALIRRILADKPLPTVNTLVDAYNLASVKTGIALAAFDSQMLQGNLLMHAAEPGGEFLGIGMKKPMNLSGGEIVISDARKIIAVYPYRDADSSKVTERTKSIVLIVCGCPGIDTVQLLSAKQVACDLISRFCMQEARSPDG